MCRAMPFSARALKKKRKIFSDVDTVVKNKSSVVERGLFSYRQRYASSQWSNFVAPRESTNILTTVMTRIVVDMSTDHAKPHSIC